ncbi:hypothetical protein AN639_00715 [Candidatus Epulonipiscium fishelsonii]|uniref:Uncharacterized protein n=1 Tax=Candidatus Epulonipiscium fishelsonii TaxID=77094 RepID=A0ACC8X758_9FIRM|nr:hypothetical protein AN396_12440 [Epulopiscium sp. SCG-B11WGA-EpuloA1]ONI41320.1 hypothetical protein AN639_00715 [Epulopiscium sp. SCG-B05WGA-EpuloA1]
MNKKFTAILIASMMVMMSGCQSDEVAETTEAEPVAEVAETTEAEPVTEVNIIEEEILTGYGDGFGGKITAKVTMIEGSIVNLEIEAPKETPGICTPAVENLPPAIVEAGNTDVDVVSGASKTSEGIIYAVNNAINPEEYPYPILKEEFIAEQVNTAPATLGLGMTARGRLSIGKDSVDNLPMYSFNEVYAAVVFDQEGRVSALRFDQLEVFTPNLEFPNFDAPKFAGYPGQSYGSAEYADDNAYLEVFDTWNTKRERGESYVMTSGTWAEQADKFEQVLVGMTLEEIREWFNKYCSDINGRPLNAKSKNEADIEKLNALSDDEKAMLVDVVASASMSLDDEHGSLIGAIEDAYNNRVAIPSGKISSLGLGADFTGRIGPGKDSTGTPIYSFNNVIAAALYDEDNNIVAINIDQSEVLSPNSSTATASNFGGFPGQQYNCDKDHDGEIDTVKVYDETSFLEQFEGNWASKKDRGNDYKFGIGTWSSQIAGYEELFKGMTASEVSEWFNKYCSDINGRPLKADSKNAEDVEKFNALSDDEKAMLIDVVASASMSLDDSHGDIVSAINKATEYQIPVNITVE